MEIHIFGFKTKPSPEYILHLKIEYEEQDVKFQNPKNYKRLRISQNTFEDLVFAASCYPSWQCSVIPRILSTHGPGTMDTASKCLTGTNCQKCHMI